MKQGRERKQYWGPKAYGVVPPVVFRALRRSEGLVEPEPLHMPMSLPPERAHTGLDGSKAGTPASPLNRLPEVTKNRLRTLFRLEERR